TGSRAPDRRRDARTRGPPARATVAAGWATPGLNRSGDRHRASLRPLYRYGMGLCRRTALRAPGPPDREARGRRSKEGKDRAEDLGTNQGIGSMARLIVGARRAVPLRSHLEHAFHALLAVAFEEEQLLVTVDREESRHRRSDRDLHGLP